MRSTTTRFKIVVAAIIVVIVIPIAAGAWLLHHADRYLPQMIAYVQKKTGKQIEIRHVTVGIFPLTVRLYDVGIRNPRPFPDGYFLKVPTVEAVMEAGPLLHRIIAIQSLTLEQPVINLISDPDGLWNFQNPVAPNQPAQKPMRFSLGSIVRLRVTKGTFLGSSLIDPSDKPGPVVLEVQDFSAEIKQIDFSAFKQPSTVIAGKLDADAAVFGHVHLKNLHTKVEILPQQFTFRQFDAKTYRGKASGNLIFNFADKKTRFDTTVQVSGVGMPYLLAEFQTGPPTMTGMMEANLKLGGEIEHTANPLAGTEGGGQFIIRNGGFPSLNQNKSMAEMKRFRNPDATAKPLSAFSTFGGDIELRNHRIYNKRVALDFYGIDVDGSGNLNEVNGALAYKGSATIVKKQGFFLSTFARMFKRAEEKNGKLTFPLRLAGTLNSPQFSVTK